MAHGEMQKSFGTKQRVQRRGERKGEIMPLPELLMLCVHPDGRTQ